MFNILFCKNTRKRFTQDMRRASRAARDEQIKNARDEEKRQQVRNAQLAVGNEGYGSPTP